MSIIKGDIIIDSIIQQHKNKKKKIDFLKHQYTIKNKLIKNNSFNDYLNTINTTKIIKNNISLKNSKNPIKIKPLDLFELSNMIHNSLKSMKSLTINLHAINKNDLISKSKILYGLITFNKLISNKSLKKQNIIFYMSKRWKNMQTIDYSCIWTLDFNNNNFELIC